MRATPWYRTVPWLRAPVAIWAVLLVLDVSVLIAGPMRWQFRVLQALPPLWFGARSALQLRKALRERAAQEQASDLDD